MRKRVDLKRMSGLLLACMLVIGMCVTVYGAVARATTMRLAATSGSRVTLKTISGSTRKITKGMRLYNGNVVETGSGSYAYISLDSSKAVKVDANAKVQVRQDGKKLKLLVNRGKLFFNVNIPLKTNESLDVQTSTMVTGVRGTCGVIEAVSSDAANVYLLEGALEINWKNPTTGKTEPVALKSGQKLTLSRNETEAPKAETLAPEDVPAFAAEEVAKDTALQQKITEMGGPDVQKIIETVEKPQQPTPEPTPAPEPEPEPTPEPTPTPAPEPTPDPTPTPDPGPAPDPTPTPDPGPAPDPTPTPDPEPAPDPTPEPEPEPEMPEWDFESGDITVIDLDQAAADGKDVEQEIKNAWNDVNIVYVKGGSTGTTKMLSLDTLSINEEKTLVLDGLTVMGKDWAVSGSIYIDMNASLQLSGSLTVNEKGVIYTFSFLKADKKEGSGKIITGGFGKFVETSKQNV